MQGGACRGEDKRNSDLRIPVNGKAAVVTVSDIDYSREAGTVEVSGDFISAGELLVLRRRLSARWRRRHIGLASALRGQSCESTAICY